MLAALVPEKAPITVMCLDAGRLLMPTEIPADSHVAFITEHPARQSA